MVTFSQGAAGAPDTRDMRRYTESQALQAAICRGGAQ